MQITGFQFLIICPLVFLAGFVDAVAGGGGLVSLPAYLISGLPVHYAIGTNKLSSGMGSALATYRFARNGYIDWKRAVCCVVCALIGSAVGANLALLIEDRIFKVIMLGILPLTGVYILKGKALDDAQAKKPYPYMKTTLISMAVSCVIGVYDGFYGPGTGTFLLLLLTSAAHMDLSSANGIAKVINVTTNFSALSIFFMQGKVVPLMGVVAGLFSILGNYLGTRFFYRSGAKSVKPLMIAVLSIFFIKVLSEVF